MSGRAGKKGICLTKSTTKSTATSSTSSGSSSSSFKLRTKRDDHLIIYSRTPSLERKSEKRDATSKTGVAKSRAGHMSSPRIPVSPSLASKSRGSKLPIGGATKREKVEGVTSTVSGDRTTYITTGTYAIGGGLAGGCVPRTSRGATATGVVKIGTKIGTVTKGIKGAMVPHNTTNATSSVATGNEPSGTHTSTFIARREKGNTCCATNTTIGNDIGATYSTTLIAKGEKGSNSSTNSTIQLTMVSDTSSPNMTTPNMRCEKSSSSTSTSSVAVGNDDDGTTSTKTVISKSEKVCMLRSNSLIETTASALNIQNTVQEGCGKVSLRKGPSTGASITTVSGAVQHSAGANTGPSVAPIIPSLAYATRLSGIKASAATKAKVAQMITRKTSTTNLGEIPENTEPRIFLSKRTQKIVVYFPHDGSTYEGKPLIKKFLNQYVSKLDF